MRTTGREWNRNGSELNHSVSNSEMVSNLYTHSAYTHLINISLLLWGVICDAGWVHILKSALLSVISRTYDMFNKTFSLFEFRERSLFLCATSQEFSLHDNSTFFSISCVNLADSVRLLGWELSLRTILVSVFNGQMVQYYQ